MHLRVPPPTEETSYIFASRSLVVRLRASLHLAHWYKRLLQVAPPPLPFIFGLAKTRRWGEVRVIKVPDLSPCPSYPLSVPFSDLVYLSLPLPLPLSLSIPEKDAAKVP